MTKLLTQERERSWTKWLAKWD